MDAASVHHRVGRSRNGALVALAVLALVAAGCGGGGGGGGSSGGGAPAPVACTNSGSGTPTVAVGNVVNHGVMHSGFVVGTSTAATSVQVSLDGGAFSPATGTACWSVQLPAGSNTWLDGSPHTIQAKATGPGGTTTGPVVNVRKGNNLDINGDGFPDVAAAQGAGILSVGGGSINSSVYLFYSHGSSGVPNGDYTAADSVLQGPGSFGFALALGDVNGDGYADVVVGAYAIGSGHIYVFHSRGATGVANQDMTSGGTAATTLTGSSSTGDFGYSLAVGDINGDGYADIVTGTLIGAVQEGTAYVFLSNPAAPGIANCDFTTSCTPATTFIGNSGVTAHNLGGSVAAGDFNGDGVADVVIGSNLGAYVFYGVSGGTISNCNFNTTCTISTTVSGPTASTGYSALAAGDVTGDGYADLVALSGTLYLFKSQGSTGFNTSTLTTAGALSTVTDSTASFSQAALGDIRGLGQADVVGLSLRTAVDMNSAGSAGIPSCDYPTTCTPNAALTSTSASSFGSFVLQDMDGDGFLDLLALPTFSNCGAIQYAYIFRSQGASGLPTVDLNSSDPAVTTLTFPNLQCF